MRSLLIVTLRPDSSVPVHVAHRSPDPAATSESGLDSDQSALPLGLRGSSVAMRSAHANEPHRRVEKPQGGTRVPREARADVVTPVATSLAGNDLCRSTAPSGSNGDTRTWWGAQLVELLQAGRESALTAFRGVWRAIQGTPADAPCRRGAEGSKEPSRNPARVCLVAETAVVLAILVWLCHGFLDALVFELDGGAW